MSTHTAVRLFPRPDGGTVAVHDLGGAGPVVLFAHATGLHGRVWQPVAETLADRARCLAVDLRGHGDSPAPQAELGELHWDMFRQDVKAVLEGLAADGEQHVTGVGHSLGGAALLMAELLEPGLFDALLVFEPAMRDGSPPPRASLEIQRSMVEVARRRRAIFDSREQALANFAGKQPLAGFQASVLLAYVRHGFADDPGAGVVLKCSPEFEALVYAESYAHGAERLLHRLDCPSTVLAGGETPAAERHMFERTAETIGAVYAELPGVDHFGPLQRPAQFAEAVSRYLLGP